MLTRPQSAHHTPDDPSPPPPAPHQRAQGALDLSFKRRGELTVLDTLRQEGCLKARFPRTYPPEWAGAVTLNCAGGIAGGDRLDTRVTAGPGTAATVATQAAERVYRALDGQCARVRTQLHVAAGAALEWLPQETILFDRCALHRTLDVTLAEGAWFLGVEALVFGRQAMDEEVRHARVHDRIALRAGNQLVLHDAIRLQGPVAPLLARPAVLGGARAVATLVHAGPNAASQLDALREALAPFMAGVSAIAATGADALLLARIAAPSGSALRRAVIAGLHVLRGGRTLPRVWQC